jgi:hypothetical protein
MFPKRNKTKKYNDQIPEYICKFCCDIKTLFLKRNGDLAEIISIKHFFTIFQFLINHKNAIDCIRLNDSRFSSHTGFFLFSLAASVAFLAISGIAPENVQWIEVVAQMNPKEAQDLGGHLGLSGDYWIGGPFSYSKFAKMIYFLRLIDPIGIVAFEEYVDDSRHIYEVVGSLRCANIANYLEQIEEIELAHRFLESYTKIRERSIIFNAASRSIFLIYLYSNVLCIWFVIDPIRRHSTKWLVYCVGTIQPLISAHYSLLWIYSIYSFKFHLFFIHLIKLIFLVALLKYVVFTYGMLRYAYRAKVIDIAIAIGSANYFSASIVIIILAFMQIF